MNTCPLCSAALVAPGVQWWGPSSCQHSNALCPIPSLLLQYAADPEPIVADSCIVALDMLEFEQSGGFQYADDGQPEAAAAAAPAAAVGASA